jgi:predicted dehydrogenase
MTYRYGGIYSPYIPVKEPLVAEMEHFISCVETGDEPVSGGRSGLAVVRVLEAAEHSLRTGMQVDLEPLVAAPA